MKKEELNFKTIIKSHDDSSQIISNLVDVGVAKHTTSANGCCFYYVTDGIVRNDNWAEDFIKDGLPLITFNDAMELIEQVEPKQPEQPKFFEFDIDKNGYFIENRAKKKGCKCQCYIAMSDYYFAGIKYKGHKTWFMDRRITNCSALFTYITIIQDIKMAIPEKIRFFNPEYKGKTLK